ncbi:MAG: EMC3/TMCO1 family protein [Candidatus Jordarchaeaceae archaeon]
MSIYTPPVSTWIILGVSLFISIITGVVNRLVLPVARIRRYSREIKKYKEAMAIAKKENNQKLLLKLERKKKFIDRITREQASVRLRPMLIFLIPFMILFYYLNGLYSPPGGLSYVIAILPINLARIPFFSDGMLGGAPFYWLSFYIIAISPSLQGLLTIFAFLNPFLNAFITLSLIPGFGIYFIWWYLITNYAFAGIFQRLFGVNFEV